MYVVEVRLLLVLMLKNIVANARPCGNPFFSSLWGLWLPLILTEKFQLVSRDLIISTTAGYFTVLATVRKRALKFTVSQTVKNWKNTAPLIC